MEKMVMNHWMEWLKPIWITLPKPQLEATAAAVQAADSTLGETSQHVFSVYGGLSNKSGGSTTMGISWGYHPMLWGLRGGYVP
jgi:hypothetical protein